MRQTIRSSCMGCVILIQVACSPSTTGTTATSGAGGTTSGAGGTTSGAGFGGTGDASTAEGFCTSLIDESAALAARCLGASKDAWSRLLDPEFECRHVKDAVSNGRLAFSSTDAKSCLSIAPSASCDSANEALGTVESSCETALVGTVPVGGQCRGFQLVTTFQECAVGTFCGEGGAQSCVGTCRAYEKDGDACDVLNGARCEPGSSCVGKRCARDLAPGAACTGPGSTACVKGYFCSGITSPGGGFCKPRQTSGPCENSSACATNYYCDASKQCSRHKAIGEACTAGAGECVSLAYCSAEKCVGTLPGIGGPCGKSTGDVVYCGEGYCDAVGSAPGVCRAKKQPGEACAVTSLGMCDGDNGHCDPATLECVSCD